MAVNPSFDVLVVGCGLAGLSAALSAAAEGASVGVLERAPKHERGGNTRYTEAYLRMKDIDTVADDFVDQLMSHAGGHLDPGLVSETAQPATKWSRLVRSMSMADPEIVEAFANNAGSTLRWLASFGIRFEELPTPFLTTSTTRLAPSGGGREMVDVLTSAAEERGIHFIYETAAVSLHAVDGAVHGVHAVEPGGRPVDIRAGSVVLACGGFEGNAEMLTRYLGPRSLFLRPVARGGYYNRGEGIEMALDIGAAPNGDFGSYHAEPVDPRSGAPEAAIFIFPYGILVNQEGGRFCDEASGSVDATYEAVTRKIYEQTNGIAYVILDERSTAVTNFRSGLRTDQPPIAADSIENLALELGIDPRVLSRTVDDFNAACVEGEFQSDRCDGLATRGLLPAKSNWARPISGPPFYAYPIISANVFTFGGLKVDSHATVINTQGDPIPGLYAAGECVGLYYGSYTGSTSVLKAAVFGRIAGAHAGSAVAVAAAK